MARTRAMMKWWAVAVVVVVAAAVLSLVVTGGVRVSSAAAHARAMEERAEETRRAAAATAKAVSATEAELEKSRKRVSELEEASVSAEELTAARARQTHLEARLAAERAELEARLEARLAAEQARFAAERAELEARLQEANDATETMTGGYNQTILDQQIELAGSQARVEALEEALEEQRQESQRLAAQDAVAVQLLLPGVSEDTYVALQKRQEQTETALAAEKERVVKLEADLQKQQNESINNTMLRNMTQLGQENKELRMQVLSLQYTGVTLVIAYNNAKNENDTKKIRELQELVNWVSDRMRVYPEENEKLKQRYSYNGIGNLEYFNTIASGQMKVNLF